MYINIYLLFKQLLLKESALMTGLMVLMVAGAGLEPATYWL
jgi:hypothetical protein